MMTSLQNDANLQLFETKPIIDHLKSFDKSHAKM